MIVKTDAIILRGRRVRETSVSLVLYSAMYGKLAVMAKGVRQAKSRLRGILEPFNEISAVVYRREGRDMQFISQVDLLHARLPLSSNYDALAEAFAVAELVDTLVHDEERNPELYALLRDVLSSLDAPQAPEPWNVLKFQCDLARVLGFAMAVETCAQCGSPVDPDAAGWFVPEEGGIVCGGCHNGRPGGTKLSPPMYKALLSLLHSPDPVVIDRRTATELRGLLNGYLLQHSGSARVLRAGALRQRGG